MATARELFPTFYGYADAYQMVSRIHSQPEPWYALWPIIGRRCSKGYQLRYRLLSYLNERVQSESREITLSGTVEKLMKVRAATRGS